ncbi:MAG: multidrug effflux MFS transporter [Caldilineaceae bacterium]|nr:multidrug effflux MFS transporter [Caldilineaceae bacterium]
MSSQRTLARLGFGEFVALMALMMSLVAMSIDIMLPALAQIGADLGVQSDNANQLVVTMIFLGLAIGQLIYGPLSDSTGRKVAIYAGYVIFIAGSLLSIFALSFPMMLLGRLLQGMGVAAPRSVSVALIRDQYEGRAMAQVMSFIMVIFILVPIIAPTIGQAILWIADWRAIFVFLLVMAMISLIWFALRQPETLPDERRAPLSAGRILRGLGEVMGTRIALGYTLMAGLISGAFQGYLSSAQQIFEFQYDLGALFPLIFALNAVALGLASFTNGKLVMRFGMRTMTRSALIALCALSLAFLVVSIGVGGQPPLWLLIAYLMLTFFCVGILFGNMNSMAMEPLGHIAGIGAAVVGSLSTFVATPLGMAIGQGYNGTVTPLVAGFAVLGFSTLALMLWTESSRPTAPEDAQPVT